MKIKRYGGKKCRKVGYKTKEEANDALKELRQRGARRFYKCPYCDYRPYHLTSEKDS